MPVDRKVLNGPLSVTQSLPLRVEQVINFSCSANAFLIRSMITRRLLLLNWVSVWWNQGLGLRCSKSLSKFSLICVLFFCKKSFCEECHIIVSSSGVIVLFEILVILCYSSSIITSLVFGNRVTTCLEVAISKLLSVCEQLMYKVKIDVVSIVLESIFF